ncbi:hypothetical protein C9418_24900 [Rhizobium sp. SEMIA 4032]|nr:hypothetical protein C9418_24900 [Rhizobium sp. SEMIA 4032]
MSACVAQRQNSKSICGMSGFSRSCASPPRSLAKVSVSCHNCTFLTFGKCLFSLHTSMHIGDNKCHFFKQGFDMPEPLLDRDRFVLGDASQHVGFLNCERISERRHIHGWRVEPHYHEGLTQIFLFWNRPVASQIDFEETRIQPPALVWMPPLVSHGFDYPEDIRGWVITVPSLDLVRLAATMPWIASWISRPITLSGEDLEHDLLPIRALFEDVEVEHGFWGEERSAILEGLFRIILVRIHRILRTVRSHETLARIPRLKLVTRFEALVDRDHLKNRSVGDYAAELSVTSTYLTRCVKAATGRSAGEIIHDRLLLEARRLIVFTDLPIAQIAYRLNFSTPSYFTRFFTQLAGEKPTIFRSRMRAAKQAE